MTPRLLLLLCLAPSLALAQGWDDSGSRRRSSGESSAPVSGFVVPTETPELDEEDDAPPKKKAPPKRRAPADDEEEAPPEDTPDLKPTGGIRLSDEPSTRRGADTKTWEEQTEKPRGPAVIEVNTAAPSIVTPEDLARDRRGTSLGSGERAQGGLGLSPRRDQEFYGTFRANDDAPAKLGERELRELERRQKERGTTTPPPSVPSGLLVSPDEPEEEPEEIEPPPRTTRPSAAPELRITGDGADRFRDSTPLVPGARGDGRLIKVEEFDTTTGIETEIVAPSSKPRPPPARRTEKPAARVEKAPEPAVTIDPPEPPVPAKPAVVETPKPVEKPAAAASAEMDPFEKFEREKAALEGRDYDAEQAAKKRAAEPSRDAALRELSSGSAPSQGPSPSTPGVPGKGAGLSIGVGGGALVLRDATGLWAPVPAFGVNVTWVPPFADAFGIDVGFWRGGRAGGGGDVFVDASFNHLALRLFLVKEVAGGVRAGIGPGALVTINSVSYAAGATNELATITRVGGDLTTFVGGRLGIVDLRLDLRGLLRGGLRLDFLPTLQAGVGF